MDRAARTTPLPPTLAPTRARWDASMKFCDTPQLVTRRMSFSMRANPTLPALETNAVPNASSVRPSGVSMTMGPWGPTIEAPCPRSSKASVAIPAASSSRTRGAKLSRVAGY